MSPVDIGDKLVCKIYMLEPMEEEEDYGEHSSLELSADALAASTQHYSEKDARTQSLEDSKMLSLQLRADHVQWSMKAFPEDWNASQFWVKANKTDCCNFHSLLLTPSSTPTRQPAFRPRKYCTMQMKPQISLYCVRLVSSSS